MTDHEERDELFARLRDADPAAALPPADPDRVARLLEDAMSHDTMTESRETGTRGRSPLTWLVAAAAVALIAAAGGFAVLSRDSDPEPPPTAAEPTVTELTMPETSSGRCMVPSAEVLKGAAYAFDGTVIAIENDTATLEVDLWYAGDETDQVDVDQSGSDLSSLILAPVFEEGQRFLVAGTQDGSVIVCGFSAPYSADLADLYAEAFGA
jgi:hypothetical protein